MPQFPTGNHHGLLGGLDGMNVDLSSLRDAQIVTNNLGQRSKAVDGGGGIADNLEGIVKPLLVYV